MAIQLGVKAKCKITGFQGIVIGKAEYLTGCDGYCLKPPVDSDGNVREGVWFDEGSLEVTGKGFEPKQVQVEEPGGPRRENPPGR